jgi:peroxiredoxin
MQVSEQNYSLEIQLKNQPGNFIVLGKIRGDNFLPLDTVLLFREKNSTSPETKKAVYSFRENTPPGIYRLILGKTTYARVMNEAPQQLDFIFNNENLIFETDFEAPDKELLVVLSEENREWYDFLRKEKVIQEKLNELELEIEYFRKKGDAGDIQKMENLIAEFNALQEQREIFITEKAEKNAGKFAARLMKMYHRPFLDGHLTIDKRREKFQQEYFNCVSFSDESLMNSAIYTDKIFGYLTSYNRPGISQSQREQEYLDAVDVILTNVNENQKVYEFILNYLVHGFEVLDMENVLDYIAENLSGTTCQTDEKTTLERKLESQKMKIGTTVPDFTLTDPEGFFVDFADVQSEKTLLLFWASWCPHCREMIAQIKNRVDNINDLQVVAISLDTSKADWLNAIAELKIEDWVHLSDLKKWDGEVATDYNIYATPTLFLIDRERKILAKPNTIQDFMNSDLN